MTNREIKARLILRGITMTEIARSLNVTHAAVSRVISGRDATPRIRQAVAQAIGVPVEEIWPDMATDATRRPS